MQLIRHILSFSALQRAEIAEIAVVYRACNPFTVVSVLFNEPKLLKSLLAHSIVAVVYSFSALQRAEIAEIGSGCVSDLLETHVSVLFNEPKLLKS